MPVKVPVPNFGKTMGIRFQLRFDFLNRTHRASKVTPFVLNKLAKDI